MKQYVNVIECAIEHNGKFLVIQHPPQKDAAGLLAFPGGKIDPSDEVHTPYDVLRATVKREVQEETGINLTDPIEYVLSSTFTTPKGIHVFNVTFYCKLTTKHPNVTIAQNEITSYAWLTPEAIQSAENAAPWLKEYIKVVKRYLDTK